MEIGIPQRGQEVDLILKHCLSTFIRKLEKNYNKWEKT
jgi:hypothetical protein